MRSHRLGAVALVCALAVLPACSKGAKHGNSTLAGNQSTASPSGATPSASGSGQGSSASPGASGSGAPSTGTSASPGASGSPTQTPPPRKVAPLNVTLSKMCITPGSIQTAHVTTAPAPKGGDPMIVVYDNQYSDGYDGQKYGGIEKNGRADKDGKYTGTWVVAINAPLGQTRLDLAVAGAPGTNTAQIYYDVKRTC